MRHAAVFFAERVADRAGRGERWDCLFCSDMLNLAEFFGLCPESVARLPAIAYFHENQLVRVRTFARRERSLARRGSCLRALIPPRNRGSQDSFRAAA